MKKIIILLLIASPLMGQEYFETTLFDVSGISSDTTKELSWKVNEPGVNIVIDFSDVNCDLLGLNIGYSPSPEIPLFIDTIPNVQLPITLDKTIYANTFRGITTHAVGVDISWYDDNYLWFNIVDNAACTSGTIKVIIKR